MAAGPGAPLLRASGGGDCRPTPLLAGAAERRWPASPLYRIEFTSADAARGLEMPLRLMLRRTTRRTDGDESATDFRIDESAIAQANNNPVRPGTVSLSLQTLRGEEGSYWLDTGRFDTLDSMLTSLATPV